MMVKLLTEHHLEFLSLKGGCRGSSESTLVKCHIVRNPMHWLIYYLICTNTLAQIQVECGGVDICKTRLCLDNVRDMHCCCISQQVN